LRAGDIDDLFTLKCYGLKSKLAGLEAQIISEVESNNYHTMQQIADMVDEKFHISVSVTAIRRLLKKRHKTPEVRLYPSKGRSRGAA